VFVSAFTRAARPEDSERRYFEGIRFVRLALAI